MQLVSAPVATPNQALPAITLRADRLTVAKRLWRGQAEDGQAFGFQLEKPLPPGAVFWQSATARYVLEQQSEPVVEISLAVTPSAAAGIGWAVGNLHLELQAEASRLLAPDEPAVRQLLERLQIPYQRTTAVFRPGRFVRGNLPSHELGPSHQH